MSEWQNFYVIVGSAGAALIGVQFVVITLVASARRRVNAEAVRAFATPNVLHFGSALAVSALMNAPWPSLFEASVVLAGCGLGGLGYCVFVFRCAARQTDYKPVLEDWVWYAALPCAAYAALTLAAVLLPTATRPALFGVGGATLSLLFIGIRNAWDSVTHTVVTASKDE